MAVFWPDFQHARHSGDAAIDFRAFGADVVQAEGDVAAYRHVRVERVALKHHGDAALAGRQMIHARPIDLDLAGIDGLQAGDYPQQGGFSTAGRAQYHQELAGADLERDVVEHYGTAEALADTPERKISHTAPRRRSTAPHPVSDCGGECPWCARCAGI